jgi:hypothetical protein
MGIENVHGFFFGAVGTCPRALSNGTTFRKEDALFKRRSVEEVS